MPSQNVNAQDYVSGEGSQANNDDDSCQHEVHLSDAEDIDEAYDIIEHEFADLIQEGTYPCLLQAFIDFDKYCMLPLLLRKPELHKSEASHSHIEPTNAGDDDAKDSFLPAVNNEGEGA